MLVFIYLIKVYGLATLDVFQAPGWILTETWLL